MSRLAYEADSTKIVQAVLSDKEAPHCIGASVKGNSLVLVLDSASWANRLRFRTTTLLTELKQIERFASIQEIVFVTNTSSGEPNASNQTP